jgi:hypothetical protein
VGERNEERQGENERREKKISEKEKLYGDTIEAHGSTRSLTADVTNTYVENIYPELNKSSMFVSEIYYAIISSISINMKSTNITYHTWILKLSAVLVYRSSRQRSYVLY